MDPDLKAFLENGLHCTANSSRTVGGGDINDAECVTTDRGKLFVKHNRPSLLGMFQAEKSGLELLADGSELRIPEVVLCGSTSRRAYLVLEWMDQGPRRGDFDERLGHGLAAQHRRTAERFGLDSDNFIGSLPQCNDKSDSWCEFFGSRRIGAQLTLAEKGGALSSRALEAGWRLVDRMPTLVPDDPEPSLLHGDLWGGNYLTGPGGEPVLIDPAVYCGHREIELAFTELFGGFSPAFYDAYNEAWPLDSAYADRRDLYNLYPLLVHANIFGGQYATRVHSVIRRYL